MSDLPLFQKQARRSPDSFVSEAGPVFCAVWSLVLGAALDFSVGCPSQCVIH